MTLDDKLKRPTTIAVITLSLALLLTSAATFVNLPQSFAQTSQASEVQLQLPKTSRYIDCDDHEFNPSRIVGEDSNHIYYCVA